MRIGSLCSGYRGLDMAIQAVVGGTVVWDVENSPTASRILAHHWPGTPNHGDLKATDWRAVEPVDVLTAGYPCQPFSHAGNRKGTDDPRHLWPFVAAAVRALRPRLLFFENVAGHVSLGLDVVLGELATLGYDARWGCLRASDIGAPHGRERVFIVAADSEGDPWWFRDGDGGAVANSGHTTDYRKRARQEPQPGSAHPDSLVQRRRTEGRDDRIRTARLVPSPGGSAALADTDNLGHERAGRAWGRRVGLADGGLTPADATSDGWDEGRPEPTGLVRRPHAPVSGPAADTDRQGLVGFAGLPLRRDAVQRQQWSDVDGRCDDACALGWGWGTYTAAVHRWHDMFRCVPEPVQPSPRGGRPQLAPRFVEWMQGLPEGHVTDPAIWDGMTPSAARNAQLTALGNGVVPPQAEAAFRLMLPDLLAWRAAA